MQQFTIDNTNRISVIDEAGVKEFSGFCVAQYMDGTFLYRLNEPKRYKLSRPLYALSCDNPASGRPGRGDFEKDFLEFLANTRKS
jgi:hypothetical protein